MNLKGILQQRLPWKIALPESDRLTLRKLKLDSEGAGRVDHNEAVRTLATEKYPLGEMYPDLREEFELHLFGGEQCAFDVWAAVTVLALAKAVLSNES